MVGLISRPWWEEFPYGQHETWQGIITPINTDFQMMRIPYPAPNASKTTLLAIHLSNSGAAARVALFDKDLLDATTVLGNRGSAAAPIITFNVPTASVTQPGDVITEVVTKPWFQTGIAVQTTVAPMYYSIYVVHQGLGA
jgi:hypothetical protein